MNFEKLLKSQADRVIAVLLAAGSIVALLAGWLGVSRNAYVANQLSYMVSGAVAAIVLLGIAATIWISADLRDEWRKLDSIDEALRSLAGTDLVPNSPGDDLTVPLAREDLTDRPQADNASLSSSGSHARDDARGDRRRVPLQARNGSG